MIFNKSKKWWKEREGYDKIEKKGRGNREMGRPKKYPVILTEEEKQQLKREMGKKEVSKTVQKRCQILLDLDEGQGKNLTYEQTSKTNCVSMSTVLKTAKQYATEGIESVIHLKRSENSNNARRKLDGRGEARIIEVACSPAPKGHARWTLRLLAEQGKVVLETPVGKDAIGRALKKTNFSLTKTAIGASRPKKTQIL